MGWEIQCGLSAFGSFTSFSGSLCALSFPLNEHPRRRSKRQTSEWTCWWLSQPEGLCSPPRIISLSGSLLAATLCVPDLYLLAEAVHPPAGLFHLGLLWMRRCSELELPVSVPVMGIMRSASPVSLRSTLSMVPTLHHSTASASGQGKSPPGKASFDTGGYPREQILSQCGKNRHGHTHCFILKPVVFILRRPCGSEGSTDRSQGLLICAELWSVRRQLRSWVGASGTKTVGKLLCILQAGTVAGWPAHCGSPSRQRKEISVLSLCCNVCLKHEISLKQRCPVW